MINKQINLAISGIVPFSTIDYPEHLSAVIFCQGCPFRCQYCHNPELIPNNNQSKYKFQDIIDLLEKRKKTLEAVVFSGGEPTLQKDLIQTMSAIKNMGYKIGLHTAGPFPKIIGKIILLLDWVGLDIKAPFSQYEQITSIPNSGVKVLQSLKLILENKIPYELRTTIHPKLLTNQQIFEIAENLKILGAKNYTLQKFRATGCNTQDLCEYDITNYPSEDLIAELKKKFEKFKVI